MSLLPRCLTVAALVTLTTTSVPLFAHDVDGPNDCGRNTVDFGDAPEGCLAYPGVIGHFPSCLAPGAPGTQEIACAPISTPPGPTGFVRNLNVAGNGYWLGCGPPAIGPEGIDSEPDAKVNSDGSPFSFCTPTLAVDCFESAFGLKFGQDECYGDNDAGLADSVVFIPCKARTIRFRTYSCATFTRRAFLNILVDWNHDGDWNDNLQACGPAGCVYEWSVKNIAIDIPPGCATQTSPSILAGPTEGPAWMRITISDTPVGDDFPWNGSAGMSGQSLQGGETEDYPVSIRQPQDPCLGYTDFGDAPEGIQAYPSGVIGNFPTCLAPGGVGTFDIDPTCGAPRSTPPGPAGYVEHVALATDVSKFWLGCGPASGPPGGVDSETNGKVSVIPPGAGMSACDNSIAVDCIQSAWAGAMQFGQDECYGDDDAGIASPVEFIACQSSTVTFTTNGCGPTTEAYLNILVDWNGDGDWNDNFACPGGATQTCAYEWAVKNVIIPVSPGCATHTSPVFTAGPRPGPGWMRISLSAQPMPDDYPWNGTAGMPGGVVHGGETEDYPVLIRQQNPCAIAYTDFGDAPEDIVAYSNGVIGHFPTCTSPGSPGTQEIMCGTALSSPPGPTGFVMHSASATDPIHYWLGCGSAADPSLGVDSEINGKVALTSGSPFTGPTTCNPAVPTDCDQAAWGMVFGQDECYGDLDAGVASFVSFRACSLGAVPYTAYLCVTDPAITNVEAYINVLVDWNQDGDWNDVFGCGVAGTPNFQCAPEWAVKNQLISLAPGCNNLVTPNFRVGPNPGEGWMRITLSDQPAPDDFPWNGSLGTPNHSFSRGETEDYPVRIGPSNVSVATTVPTTFEFAPIVPNPSREASEIRFGLPRDADVSLIVYDVTGREVNMLIDRHMPAGEQSMRWDFRDSGGRPLPAGIYVVVLRAGGQTLTRRAIHLH